MKKNNIRRRLGDGRWVTVEAKRHWRHWPTLRRMPLLSHWPDRTVPYAPERSEVLGYIARQCGVDLDDAGRILAAARKRGVIRFDATTGLWAGEEVAR